MAKTIIRTKPSLRSGNRTFENYHFLLFLSFFFLNLVFQMINAKASKASFLFWCSLLVKYMLWKTEKIGKSWKQYYNKVSWDKKSLSSLSQNLLVHVKKVYYKTRSSHPEVFLVKGVLKICSKFTGL